MVTLACPYCGRGGIEMTKNEEQYTEFKCYECGYEWGMEWKMVEPKKTVDNHEDGAIK
jgi:uncharacterized Zn finger protein